MRSRFTLPMVLALITPWASRAAQPAPPQTASAGVVAPVVAPVLALRVRPELWDWFRAADDRGPGRYAFVGVHARAGLAQQRARWGWRAELAAPALLALPDDANEGAPRGQLGLGGSYAVANGVTFGGGRRSLARVFLKQGFVRVGAPPKDGGHALRLGRWEFSDGAEVAPASQTVAAVKRDRVSQRLIGPFGWSHVGRSFDGGHYSFDRGGRNVTALLARPTQGAFDANGWDELDVTLGYASLTLPTNGRRLAGDVRLFAAYYDDARGVLKTDNRPLAQRQGDDRRLAVATAGGHWVQTVRTGAGEADVLLWGALQGGDWGRLSHRAHAAAAEAGLQPAAAALAPLHPWVRAGWYRASGDGDAADDRHGTFFTMLPTPRIYARFPFFTPMNVEDAFASLLLRPRSTVTARFDARRLRLAERADLWYAGGGAFEHGSFGYAGRPSNGARPLAALWDLSVDWRLTTRWTLGAYAARADGGAVVERIFPGRGRAHFGYAELSYAR
ncbi:MAG TPA: hypothetical protein VKA84_06980 [Gemmatimonadaceae bacterium]|nr:hypothetical protein [Gemmatimonadaceae bacterium]